MQRKEQIKAKKYFDIPAYSQDYFKNKLKTLIRMRRACVRLNRKMTMRPKSNFSLKNKYITNQIGRENIENHRLNETVLMKIQILRFEIKQRYNIQQGEFELLQCFCLSSQFHSMKTESTVGIASTFKIWFGKIPLEHQKMLFCLAKRGINSQFTCSSSEKK